MTRYVLIAALTLIVLVGAAFSTGFYKQNSYYMEVDPEAPNVTVIETGRYDASFPVKEYIPDKYTLKRENYQLDITLRKRRFDISFKIKAYQEHNPLVVAWVGEVYPEAEDQWVMGEKYPAYKTENRKGYIFKNLDEFGVVYKWNIFAKWELEEVIYLYLMISDQQGKTLGEEKIPFRFKVYGWSWAFDGI